MHEGQCESWVMFRKLIWANFLFEQIFLMALLSFSIFFCKSLMATSCCDLSGQVFQCSNYKAAESFNTKRRHLCEIYCLHNYYSGVLDKNSKTHSKKIKKLNQHLALTKEILQPHFPGDITSEKPLRVVAIKIQYNPVIFHKTAR